MGTPLTPDQIAYETEIANDLVKRGLMVLPVFVLLAGLARGVNGALSAALAVTIVLFNFVLAARSLSWAARRGPNAIAATVFVGYAIRLGIVTVAFLLLRDQSWFDKIVFGVTLIVTHVGLLFWETRYVSLTLAAPGLRPGPERSPREN